MTWSNDGLLREELLRPKTRVLVWLGLLVFVGCAGSVETVPPAEDDDNSTGGRPFVYSGGTSSTGGADGDGGMPETGGVPATGGVPYVEPECPDEPPPPVTMDCDPLAEENECGAGQGCFPYLVYPNGEECGDPQFGAYCALAGKSTQGSPCGDGVNSCAAGHMCILGVTGGKRCARICEPSKNHMCPDGLICGTTDVKGYGVCY